MKAFFSSSSPLDPALRLHHLGNNGDRICLVDISWAATEMERDKSRLLSLLSPEEQRYLQRFRFAGRRHEWISGRIAAKGCLVTDDNIHADQFTILPDRHGRPITTPSPGTGQSLSISHSKRYAVAMTATGGCGIDIQHISPRILKVRERLAGGQEQELACLAVPESRETGLTMLWAVKEALKKHRMSSDPGIFEAITVRRIGAFGENGIRTVECTLNGSDQSCRLRIIQLDEYILAWSPAL